MTKAELVADIKNRYCLERKYDKMLLKSLKTDPTANFFWCRVVGETGVADDVSNKPTVKSTKRCRKKKSKQKMLLIKKLLMTVNNEKGKYQVIIKLALPVFSLI